MIDDKCGHFCSMTYGLPLEFLPLERVHGGIEFLKQKNIPEANELLNYFDITYVIGSYKRIGASIKKRQTLISTENVKCI